MDFRPGRRLGQVAPVKIPAVSSFPAFLRSLSFNLLGPETEAGADDRFHLKRPDGTVATLLDADAFVLEWANASFASTPASSKQALEEVADMPKMSTLTIGAIINSAVTHMPADQTFVNVGVWHGFSYLAGLNGNGEKAAVGIDNFSQFGGPRDQFMARFEAAASSRHSFVESDYRDFFKDAADPIGVYIYDGEHTYESQVEGLRVAEPYLAEGCIIIVDDTNWRRPRKATYDFIAHSPRDYSVLLDIRTSGQHPTMWNGMLVLRADGEDDGEVISSIPSPEVATIDEPPAHAGTSVSALVGPGDSVARARTRKALEAQSHTEIEVLTFGDDGETTYQSGAAEAFAASSGDYVTLLDAGAEPDPRAIERALAAATGPEEARPYEWRNQRGKLRT
jgi:hypothetical protein